MASSWSDHKSLYTCIHINPAEKSRINTNCKIIPFPPSPSRYATLAGLNQSKYTVKFEHA